MHQHQGHYTSIETVINHACMDNKAPNLMCGFRCVQNLVPYSFSTPQNFVNLIHAYLSQGFGNSHTKFGVLLSMHAWVMTVSNFGFQIFLVTLMLVHKSPKKMCL